MDARECLQLTALVGSLCPAMKLEPTTADAWLLVLGRYALDECTQAALRAAETTEFISVAHIVREVKRARGVDVQAAESARVLEAAKRKAAPPNIDYEVAAAQLRIDSAARNAALKVRCRHCEAGVNTRCVVYAGGPALMNLPAHHVRMQDAGLPAPTPVLPDRQERPGDELARAMQASPDEPLPPPPGVSPGETDDPPPPAEREPRAAFETLDPDDWRNDAQTDADDPGG